MRYRCLILDHDDTAVDSTRGVHHPAHIRSMQVLRPDERVVDLETWFRKNFDPGITSYLMDELGFSEAEMEVENSIWREFSQNGRSQFFPGFLEALARYQECGGCFVVASHSEEDVIRAHYRAGANGATVQPELVFGWDLGPEKRKPKPYAVLETLRRLGLRRDEVLVVDDLKPGIDMARAARVDAAAAGWCHNISEIREFMSRECVATFETVEEFAQYILQ
jgi:phosphoglycolate phosphatase/pyrophosphatase PpaX